MKKMLFETLVISCLVLLLIGCSNQGKDVNQLNGRWIADGTQMKAILEVVDGEPIYADDYDLPYYLDINEDGTYLLTLNNESKDTEKGKYNVIANEIRFSPEVNEGFIWACQLLNNNELHCENYATVFTKDEVYYE